MPAFRQVFVAKNGLAGDELERHVYVGAASASSTTTDAYFPSLSARVVVYKGMLTPDQLQRLLRRPAGRAARVRARASCTRASSTNTFPSWPLAHPYRMLAHNGEINTVQGNENWMRAREGVMESDVLPGDARARLPDLHARTPSDTARFDEALELLSTWRAGRCTTRS